MCLKSVLISTTKKLSISKQFRKKWEVMEKLWCKPLHPVLNKATGAQSWGDVYSCSSKRTTLNEPICLSVYAYNECVPANAGQRYRVSYDWTHPRPHRWPYRFPAGNKLRSSCVWKPPIKSKGWLNFNTLLDTHTQKKYYKFLFVFKKQNYSY